MKDKQIAWRGGGNGRGGFAFADTHAKTLPRGALRDEKWDVLCRPGVGCDGHSVPPKSTDYPAPDGSCLGSALNCK